MDFVIFILCAICGGLFGYGVFLLFKKPGSGDED
jgi:H+/Cl- antiporter ClcA